MIKNAAPGQVLRRGYLAARCLLLGMVWTPLTTVSAAVPQPPAAVALLPLADPVGVYLLQNNLTRTATRLLMHYVTQATPSFCGVASAVMILNNLALLPPLDAHGARYFTQDNFFSPAVSALLPRPQVLQYGINLAQLASALATWGARPQVHLARQLTLPTFRQLLRQTLDHDDFVIVNFSREALGQAGGGHHAPLAAYDAATDQWLILDVARYKYAAFWVATDALWAAVNTTEASGDSRGVLLVALQPAPDPRKTLQ